MLKKIKLSTVYLTALTIFILINLVFIPLSLRLDLSKGQVNTLSSSTRKILKNLDDIINIKFFVSSDLPTRLLPLKTEVTDLLAEYKKENKGKINIKILDPKKDTNALNETKELGVPALQFSQLEKDKYALTTAYFGIVLSYGDKKEILPQVTEVESLEYNLTASIYKMTTKELIKIGVVSEQENGLSTLKKVLSQQFEVGEEIEESDKALLIFDDNKKRYDSDEIEKIKKYLDNRGRVIFFVDGVWVADNLTTSPASHNLFNLIANYGIKINKNLVLSTSAELVNFGNSLVSFMVPYPFWVKTNNFNQKTSHFSNVNQLTFPWVSSLTLEKKEGTADEFLVKTGKQSWAQSDNFILNPQDIPNPQTKDLKEFIVSAYAKKNNGGEIVVIPSSRFVTDRYLSRTSNNLDFVLNIVSNFAAGGALSGIRQKAVAFYPLPDLGENQKDIFKYLNILLLPSLFGLFGTIRLLKRR